MIMDLKKDFNILRRDKKQLSREIPFIHSIDKYFMFLNNDNQFSIQNCMYQLYIKISSWIPNYFHGKEYAVADVGGTASQESRFDIFAQYVWTICHGKPCDCEFGTCNFGWNLVGRYWKWKY